MNRYKYGLAVALLSLFAGSAVAATAYVTDQLRLGVHASADTSDKAFTNITSGDRVEILEETLYYALVKIPGGRQGWVKKNYLVPDPPAALIVAEMERERDKALTDLVTLESSLADREARVNSIETEFAEREVTAQAEREELIELREIRVDLERRLDSYGFSVPGGLFFAAIGASLVGGFLVCWWWIDRRSRARHGGFRIQ